MVGRQFEIEEGAAPGIADFAFAGGGGLPAGFFFLLSVTFVQLRAGLAENRPKWEVPIVRF